MVGEIYLLGLPKNTKIIPITIAAAATIAMVGTKLDKVTSPVSPKPVALKAAVPSVWSSWIDWRITAPNPRIITATTNAIATVPKSEIVKACAFFFIPLNNGCMSFTSCWFYNLGLPKKTSMIPITIAAAATIAIVGTKLDNVTSPPIPNWVTLNATFFVLSSDVLTAVSDKFCTSVRTTAPMLIMITATTSAIATVPKSLIVKAA